MDISFIIDLIAIGLCMISAYTPQYQLRKREKLSTKELNQKYPEYKWIKWAYIFVSLILAPASILLMLYFITTLHTRSVSLFGIPYALIGLYNGLVAFITDVCIYPIRSPRFLYVVGEEGRAAGKFQVFFSLCALVIVLTVTMIDI